MKPFDLTTSSTPRTDALIAKVMAEYPTNHLAARGIKATIAQYFEAVHQELAPLCRELEAENWALREAMCHPKLKPNLPGLASSDAETISRASAPTAAPTGEHHMIKPTVGRVVWFHVPSNVAQGGFCHPSEGEPLAAIVARVWNDRLINLVVFDANGVSHSRTSVMLVQEGDVKPDGYFAEWMPYQVGQAKKDTPAA